MKIGTLLVILFLSTVIFSQEHHRDQMMHGMYGSYPMGRDATGTSWMPSSTEMPGIQQIYQNWLFMIHGAAMVIDNHQGGPRGESELLSENMFMFTAQRDIGQGTFAVRNMLSLESATIACKGYPLLLQSGETCNGITPLIDHQHPPDVLMELAALYTYRFSEKKFIEIHHKQVLFTRAEYAAKDGLFLPPNPHAGQTFNVGKFDLGYIFEFPLVAYTLWGIGFVRSASFVSHSIKSAYGGTPLSYMAFLRIELFQKSTTKKM